MLPTRRTVRLSAVLAGAALAAFALDVGSTVGTGIAAGGALLVLAVIVDLARTPAPGAWSASRELPASCGLGRELERVLVLAGGERAAGLAVEVREEFPASCEVTARTVDGAPAPPREGDPTGGPDTGVLDGRGGLRAARRYACRRRGRHRLGRVRLRVRGRLGLALREVLLGGGQAFDVEPALAGLSRTLALAASERWRDLGVRRVRRHGGGMEFESLRDHAVGDDPRRLDQKATARRGKPTVRQYQEERGQELVLLVDCGRRMRATGEEGPGAGWTKLDWALDASLQLAAVVLARGDRVGCLAFDDRVLAFEPPARGARALRRLRRALFDLEPSTRESDHAHALRALAARHRRRALVLVVSDVADPLSIADQRRALSAAARRHRVVFAALDDPVVRRLADGDEVVLSEDAAELPDAALRAVAIELDEDRRSALRELRGGGVRVFSSLPAESAAPLLSAWLAARGG